MFTSTLIVLVATQLVLAAPLVKRSNGASNNGDTVETATLPVADFDDIRFGHGVPPRNSDDILPSAPIGSFEGGVPTITPVSKTPAPESTHYGPPTPSLESPPPAPTQTGLTDLE